MDVTFSFFSVTVVALFGDVYGNKQTDPLYCKIMSEYHPCECSSDPTRPSNGYIKLDSRTHGTYHCNEGYYLNVYPIIRCHKGVNKNQNFWNTSQNACLDYCNPNPCYNSGVCNKRNGDYTCNCQPGYTGKSCSEFITTVRETASDGYTNHTIDADLTGNHTNTRNTKTGTSSMTTYTMISQPETTTSSSGLHAETSAKDTSIAAFSSHSPKVSSTKTVSSSFETSEPAASREVNSSDINAAYIAVPVVVCVIALLVGVGILWWRRTPKPAALFERREPGSLITNQVYGANGIDRQCSLMTVRQSKVNEYAEIHLDIMNSGETVGDTYQTIDILPEDKADMKKSYDNFKLSETEFIDTNYSHIGLNSTRNNTHADNTYSHTRLENVTQKPEITVSGDDTYNKLNTTTLSNRTGQSIENTETEYNHAQAGGQDPKIEADNYSHLNTNMRTQGESTTKMPHQQNEDNNKNSNIRQLPAKDLPSNTGYEFAKDFDNLKRSSEIKMLKQDDARKNQNSNMYAKDLPSNTGYEFAKDFENKKSSSDAPEYAMVTKKKPALDKADNAVKGYETAVGTKHNYLILEPEKNPTPNAALFNVVEDEFAETDEMSEAETGHEYYTLEKQYT